MRTWIVLAAALTLAAPLSLGTPAAATAQVRVRRAPPHRPPPPPPTSQLGAAAQRLAAIAAQEAPGQPFTHHAARFAAVASRGDRRAEHMYARTRRMLLSGQFQPSDNLLDAWDDVVVAWYATYPRPVPPPMPPPPVQPPPPQVTYQIEGRFERTPFRFAAASLDELDRACLSFAGATDTRRVDDAIVGTTRIRNRSSYWNDQALCSLVVLNATSGMPPTIQGTIEEMPFAVSGPPHEVRRILSIHIPRLTQGMRIDDMVIAGQAYRNGPSYWSPDQIVTMIVSQLPGGGAPPVVVAPPRGRLLSASGTIERTAFAFSGNGPRDIQIQCQTFVSQVVREWVDDIEVNGQRLHSPQGYWNPEQVCQIIAERAR